jgi:holin-like protein
MQAKQNPENAGFVMRIIYGLSIASGMALLIGLSLAGTTVAQFVHLAIPGPVLGLCALLLLLAMIPKLENAMAPACDFITRHLGLFIIPSAVGLGLYQNTLKDAPFTLLLVLTGSTLITGLVAALLWRRAP